MGSRFSKLQLGILAAACGVALSAQEPASQEAARAAARRAGDRISALLREAESLAAQQSKVLVELRGLEAERQARSAELARLEREINDTRRKLADSAARAETLTRTVEHQRPDVEARLVQLYKLGAGGHWRMLLDAEDLRSIGRTYRTAAALTHMGRDRVHAHRKNVDTLARERKELETRAKQLGALQQEATQARAALDRAVAQRTALADSMDARRDLNAQLTSELQAAQQRIQASFQQLEGTADAAAVALPLAAFQGALPWPVRGSILTRFGRQPSSRFGTAVVRNGIEIGVPEGQIVTAVHEGTVAFADQFTGYGTLVIVDHGDSEFSLYGHLASVRVAKGDRVAVRSPVGNSGRDPSGRAAAYFELRVDGRPVDPLQWLQRIP